MVHSFGQQRVLDDGVAQVRDNARVLKLWHPLKQFEIAPEPMLALWGPGLSKWEEQDQVRVIEDVTVVVGPALHAWIGNLTITGVLSEEQVASAWRVLETRVAGRDRVDSALRRLPTSVAEGVARLALAVGFAARSSYLGTTKHDLWRARPRHAPGLGREGDQFCPIVATEPQERLQPGYLECAKAFIT